MGPQYRPAAGVQAPEHLPGLLMDAHEPPVEKKIVFAGPR
jgi:hypothetical protein